MNRKQRRAAAKQPHADLASAFSQALALHQAGRLAEAEKIYGQILKVHPKHFDSLHLVGVIYLQRGNHVESVRQIDLALKINPKAAYAHNNRGLALQKLKRLDEAMASYDKAIAYKSDYAEAFYNRGNTLKELQRLDDALASYDKAIVLKPDYVDAFNSRFNVLRELKRLDEALASYDKAIVLKPDYVDAFNNRGIALQELKRFDEALASYDKALALKPDYAEAFNNRGIALQELKRFDEALASYDKALALKPDYAEAFTNRGIALQELQRFDEALASYDRALAAKADHAHAFSGAAFCVIRLCDWDRRMWFARELGLHISGKKSIISPFLLLAYSDKPALQLQCARSYSDDQVPLVPRPFWTGATWRHDKLRIAYLSADFHRHATAYLITELFERHDRSRFQVIGVSFGVDDKSDMRRRLVVAFDRFYDVRRKDDEEVAKLLHDLQVDIAIDLKGYTQNSRPGILAYRPTPIQASYLGFPGTMGAEFMDYIIADETVVPFEHQPFYAEKIVHLPDCYQVNDTKRNIAVRTPTRQEAGLPEKGYVFCCFNNNWKITPEVFRVWIRLLHAVEGSVLWLFRENESAERNLRKEAQARGIDPVRLVFADRLPLEDHLARHRLADLFLDTLPYNAHTTASDALWVGLPVLTCMGNAFAGRVAASLLNAIGLPELVTHSIEDYEALALRLAKDPSLLEGYRNRLATNRLTHPLFDIDRFLQHIEAAYLKMWGIWQRGEQPRSFAVEARVSKPERPQC
jgi:predicted O-linked N-acetylglucosamine transferase (SPINDLY family)